jgi:hypothetical protein
VSQPSSDTPSSPRPRSPAGYGSLFLVSAGVLWFLLWWNHHGLAVISSVVSLTVTRLDQIGVTSAGTLTVAASILGGLAITVWAYLADRPRPTATAPPRPARRIDPNSPIEMPLPPGASPTRTVLLAVFLGTTAVVMVLLPLVEAVVLLSAFEFRTRDELIGDGFTAYGLISGGARFLASVFLGGLAVSAVASAYRRASANQPDDAP